MYQMKKKGSKNCKDSGPKNKKIFRQPRPNQDEKEKAKITTFECYTCGFKVNFDKNKLIDD